MADSRTRGVVNLATGGVLASILALVMLPLVTRFYPPEVYAQFALVMTVTVILFTIATGKYEQAIPLCPHTPEGEEESWRLGRLAVGVAVTVCLSAEALAVFTVVLLHPQGEGIPAILLATPILVLMTCLGGVQSMILTRQARYRSIAVHQTVRIFLQFICQAALGAVSPTEESLLLGFGISLLPSSASAVTLILRAPRGLGRARDLARSYRNLPMHQAPTALVRALEINSSLFVLAATFGDYLVGLYAVSLRLVMSPAVLIASSVNTVYLREAPRLDPPSHRRFYRKLFGGLTALGVVMTAGLAVAAAPIADILGPEWQSAKSVIYASLPLGLAAFVGALPSSALLILGRTRELLLSRLAITTLPSVAIVGCFWAGTGGIAAILVSSVALLSCVVAFSWSTARRLTEQEVRVVSSLAQDDARLERHGG